MTIPKEKLSDLKERFEFAQNLITEESKNDSALTPYMSHYKARDILIELEEKLNKEIAGEAELKNQLIFKSILGTILKDVGKINCFVEETDKAEAYLKKALNVLVDHKLECEIIIGYADTLNQLGILFSKLLDDEKSKTFLIQSEEIVKQFKESNKKPLTIFDIFGTEDEIEEGKGEISLEKTHTLTFFYLAQVFGSQGDLTSSASYCHSTLKRQLELKDYDPIEWALNSATLSQYYFGRNMLLQSRHLLAASCYMLEHYTDELDKKENISEEQRAAFTEALNHRTADVSLCCAKYCIYILSTSIDRLMQEKEDSDPLTDAEKFKLNPYCERFNLNLDLYERQMASEFCLTFDDAKAAFLGGQAWLNKAKIYYTLESEASQYARIVQDFAQLYKHLAFFEEDPSTQAKLHKRRSDQLEGCLKQLNPNFYMNITRELAFELGLTYSDMLDIKCDLLKYSEVKPQALNKINVLAHKAIKKFLEFIDSYRDKKTADFPKSLDPDELQVIACANFNLGRLYYKLITPDKKLQLENTTSSYQYYKAFVDSSEKHQNIAEKMRGELGVTKQMIELLPLKMKKLNEEINA